MSHEILIWVMSAGIIQGVFLTVAIFFLDVRNRWASRFLAAIVTVMTIMIFGEFLDLLNAPVQFNAGFAFELALGPLIYFFAYAIKSSDIQLDRRAMLHFLPLFATLGLLVPLHLAFGDNGFTTSNPTAAPFIMLWALAKIPYFFAYAWAADKLFEQTLSSTRRKHYGALIWVRRWFLALYAIAGIIYLNLILFIAGLPAVPDPDIVGAVLIAATTFSVAYFIMVNRGVLDAPADRFMDKETRALEKIIATHLDRDRPYEDPEFTLAQLAVAVGVDENRISQALSIRSAGGFYELINEKRITSFDRLLTDPENRDRTILDLAFHAGFNSKATFYRAFKAKKGVTPNAYRKQLAEKTKISASH